MSGICSIHKDFNPACTICLSDKVVEIETRILKLEARKKSSRKSSLMEEEWFDELKKNPLYEGIDITREYLKMSEWCKARGFLPTRRRFINWINKTDKPLNGNESVRSAISDKYKEELRLLLNNSNNKCLPWNITDGAKVVFRSTGMSWSKLQESVQAGIIPF